MIIHRAPFNRRTSKICLSLLRPDKVQVYKRKPVEQNNKIIIQSFNDFFFFFLPLIPYIILFSRHARRTTLMEMSRQISENNTRRVGFNKSSVLTTFINNNRTTWKQ